MIKRLFRDRPAEAGEAYGAPGAGSSPWMSIASVALILGGWFVVTQNIWGNGIQERTAHILRQADAMTAAAKSLAGSGDDNMRTEMEYIIGHADDLRSGATALQEEMDKLQNADNDALAAGLDAAIQRAGDLASSANRAEEDAKRLEESEGLANILDAAAAARESAFFIQSTARDIIDHAARRDGDLHLDVPLVKPLFVPSPQAVYDTFVTMFSEEFSGGTLDRHTLDSIIRVFLGFLFAILVGVPLGVLMGINRHVRGFWDPPIEFYRPIPPLAYLPLMIVWFGLGEEPKVLLISLAVFAPVVINTRAGVRSVAIEQIHAAYSMGATKLQVIWHVILKGAMPEILTGMRIGVAFGWTTLVAAELAAAQAGLGAMIKSASDFLVTDVIFVGIFVIAAIAYFFDLVMRWIDRLAVPWKGKI